MSGFNYTFRIINSLEIIIMLFIRYVLNYDFMKRNLLMKIRLRWLSLLCFHRIGSWSINTVSRITNTTHNLCKISIWKKSMMNSLWEINHQHLIGTTPLSEVNYSSKFNEKVDGQNNHQKNFGKSKKGKRNKYKEQIQRPKFGERQETFQVSSLWWS
jgi:hypothetical protein